MLHNSRDMPKEQIISDPKSIEKYGGSRMYFALPIDYDTVMRRIPRGKLTTVEKIRNTSPRRTARTLPGPSRRARLLPAPRGPASSSRHRKRPGGARSKRTASSTPNTRTVQRRSGRSSRLRAIASFAAAGRTSGILQKIMKQRSSRWNRRRKYKKASCGIADAGLPAQSARLLFTDGTCAGVCEGSCRGHSVFYRPHTGAPAGSSICSRDDRIEGMIAKAGEE